MKSQNLKFLQPTGLVFTLFLVITIVFRNKLEAYGFDTAFLIYANLLLGLVTIAGLLVQLRGLRSPNPQAFVRGVYVSLIVKMFVCMIAVFIYAFINKENLNKPAIFTSMGMYIVYTVVEVMTLMKAAKNNAH